MPNSGHMWSNEEIKTLINDFTVKSPTISLNKFCEEWGKEHNISPQGARGKLDRMRFDQTITAKIVNESPYPIYDEPLVLEGDATVIPDIEFPFHNADFTNRVLDLSQKWNIRQCIMAGDVLHFDSLSGWDPSWSNVKEGGVTSEAEKLLMQFAKQLPSKKQGEMIDLIVKIGEKDEKDGVSTELKVARRELSNIQSLFDRCDYVIGNHEGRLLRALNTTISPEEIRRLVDIDNPKWRIAPFYFSYLDTVEGRFIVEHPKNASKFSAGKLASKYQCHVLMAHSHQLNYTFDPSGMYYAIEMGCMVDENRLPYASQRHNVSPTHILGAVIVRDGVPYLLHPHSPWDRLKNM